MKYTKKKKQTNQKSKRNQNKTNIRTQPNKTIQNEIVINKTKYL